MYLLPLPCLSVADFEIGSGLAGLTTAYLLSLRTRWEVSIFEKADEVGVDAASIEVKVLKDGKSLGVGIDVPMRSIEAGTISQRTRTLSLGYYPRLLKLLNDLDIAIRPDDLTFAFSREKARIPYLIYNGLSGRQGFSVPATKSYLTAIFEILYYSLAFIYLYIVSLLHYRLHFFPRINEITFEEFCTDYLIPSKFSREVLVPLYSGVCTCKESDILKYPAGLIVGITKLSRC
jgi:predicted NAD/FAD-binding protein